MPNNRCDSRKFRINNIFYSSFHNICPVISTLKVDLGQELKVYLKQEHIIYSDGTSSNNISLHFKMGNCCGKNAELEQFEKDLIHFKDQDYEEIKAR